MSRKPDQAPDFGSILYDRNVQCVDSPASKVESVSNSNNTESIEKASQQIQHSSSSSPVLSSIVWPKRSLVTRDASNYYSPNNDRLTMTRESQIHDTLHREDYANGIYSSNMSRKNDYIHFSSSFSPSLPPKDDIYHNKGDGEDYYVPYNSPCNGDVFVTQPILTSSYLTNSDTPKNSARDAKSAAISPILADRKSKSKLCGNYAGGCRPRDDSTCCTISFPQKWFSCCLTTSNDEDFFAPLPHRLYQLHVTRFHASMVIRIIFSLVLFAFLFVMITYALDTVLRYGPPGSSIAWDQSQSGREPHQKHSS